MCGIFGLLAHSEAHLNFAQTTTCLNQLYRLSESRGKESAGLHLYLPLKKSAWTLKAATSATELIGSSDYRELINIRLQEAFDGAHKTPATPIALLAHSRLVTNGTAETPNNNQPVTVAGTHMIHNGIVVNVEQLWQQHPHLQRQSDVDTEVMAALLAEQIAQGIDPITATRSVYHQIKGAASIAWVQEERSWALLATNTGDLYYYTGNGFLLFASERYILAQVITSLYPSQPKKLADLHWLPAGNGLAVDLNTVSIHHFSLQHSEPTPDLPCSLLGPIQHHDLTCTLNIAPPHIHPQTENETLLRYNATRLLGLKRCQRCILPITFPFISFDAQGICNYCHHYSPRYQHYDPQSAKQALMQRLDPYRRKNGLPEVLTPFSGGRDSSYMLHLLKKELGLTPISFTYDWGMVTDLARRNIARLCGQLGVQNILVSADIAQKRRNIAKNVAAWLKKPDLGIVPLFMAGDKHFLCVVNQLKRQTNIRADLWSVHPLENTDFKVGFCGIAPRFSKERIDALSWQQKIKMVAYYGKQFLLNPRYLNSSLGDTFTAFLAYYFEPRTDYLLPFDYLLWDESTIERTLIDRYGWELSPDTTSTWRIGDGSAAFYNYIYVTARGFSEFDTFRSNQIREGMLDRDTALQRVLEENRPRFPSLCWYFNTIGIPFNDAINKTNQLDVLGLHQ